MNYEWDVPDPDKQDKPDKNWFMALIYRCEAKAISPLLFCSCTLFRVILLHYWSNRIPRFFFSLFFAVRFTEFNPLPLPALCITHPRRWCCGASGRDNERILASAAVWHGAEPGGTGLPSLGEMSLWPCAFITKVTRQDREKNQLHNITGEHPT